MQRESAAASRARVLVDHVSPEGKTITHVRGILVTNSIANLKNLGLFDAYQQVMPRRDLQVLVESVANSWVPVEHVVAHYAACDELSITPAQLEEIGSRQARRVTDTFLGGAIRRARGFGVDAVKQTIQQVDRLHGRLYLGGGCAVLDTGPKDIFFEISGFPFAASRTFRAAWLNYAESMGALFCKVAYVRFARPREVHPHNLALTFSWV